MNNNPNDAACAQASSVTTAGQGAVSEITVHKESCVKCGRKFTTTVALNRHIKIHNFATHFLCERCGRRIVFERQSATHSFTHAGSCGPHSCTCGATFSSREVLTKHIKRHSSNRNMFVCVCGNLFRQQFVIRARNCNRTVSEVGKLWGDIAQTNVQSPTGKTSDFNCTELTSQ